MKVMLNTITPTEMEISPNFYDYDYYMRGCQTGKSAYCGGWGYQYFWDADRDSIIEYFGKVKSMVDIGCALGNLVKAFEGVGVKSHGFEYSYFCVESAHSKNVWWANIDKGLPVPDNYYELVVCIEVLEHVEDVESAVKELCRVSDKWIFITTPDDTEVREGDYDAGHINIHGKEWWIEMFEKNGVKLQKGYPKRYAKKYRDPINLVFKK